MVRKILYTFIGYALVYQVFTANLQNLHPALKQYILAGLNTLPVTTPQTYPSIAKPATTPNYQTLAALANLLATPSLTTLPKPQPASHSTSSLLAALTGDLPGTASNGIDASLLNNLAVALQLLLVSNILNSPTQETTPESLAVPAFPIYENKEPAAPLTVAYTHNHNAGTPVQTVAPNPYVPHYEQPLITPSYNPYDTHMNYNPYESTPNYGAGIPNANFVGASTFADSNPFGGSVPPASVTSSSRGGFSLMSPYEALSPSSPYSDPILSSPYGSVMTSKKDFQSPYSTIMAADNKDLFSMSDFF